MAQPVIFLGWGGPNSTDAIFSVCPEYIGNRKIAIFFDEKSLARYNETVQSEVGSGFTVDSIIPESPDGKCGVIIMSPDASAVKEAIVIGQETRSAKEIGCEYTIAFYCCGESDLAIVAFDEDDNFEDLYTRSFCCK